MNLVISARQILATVLLLYGIHHTTIVQSAQKEVLPTSAAELIPLFENASGEDADLVYRINFAFRKNTQAESLPELRKAMQRWVDRSSGITLTFTLDCWNRLRVETDSELSTENVQMLIGLLTDPRYTSKTARQWVSENKKHWPCRSSYTVDLPETILALVNEHHLDLLLTKTSTPDAALRAGIIRIIGMRSVNVQSRRNQGTHLATLAGSTAASLIKQVNPKEQAKFVAELTRMLQQSGTTRAALRVLAKLGSSAGTSAPTIKSLTQHKQDDVRLDATAAIWTIAKDTETCLPILLNGLKSESTQARNTASDTLIETGG